MSKKRNVLFLACFAPLIVFTVSYPLYAVENEDNQNAQEGEEADPVAMYIVYDQLRDNYVIHDSDYQDLKGDFNDAKDNQGANLEEIRDGVVNYLDTFSASNLGEGIVDSISNTINLIADGWEALSDREKVKRISDALHDIRTDILIPFGDQVQTARQDWLKAGGEEVIPPAIFLCAGGGTCKTRYPSETDTDTHHITCPYAPCVTTGYQYWECQVSGRVCPRSEEHTHIPSKSESSASGICPICLTEPHSPSGSGSGSQ